MNDAVDPLDVLRVAVGHGLPGGELEAAASGVELLLDEDVIALADRHRVQGLLWTAVEDGVVVGDEAQVNAARQAREAALHHCHTSQATAALTIDALRSADIQARVLKGIAIANLDHADPTERMFGDADLLIRRTDYAAALAALTSADFVRVQPAVRGWWEQRFGKAIVFRAPTGGELDLHLAITGGYFGARIDHDELWASTSEPFLLDGVQAHGLDRQGRLLHACCHAVLGGGSGFRALRDVAQLVLISDADWRSVVERSRRDGSDLVDRRRRPFHLDGTGPRSPPSVPAVGSELRGRPCPGTRLRRLHRGARPGMGAGRTQCAGRPRTARPGRVPGRTRRSVSCQHARPRPHVVPNTSDSARPRCAVADPSSSVCRPRLSNKRPDLDAQRTGVAAAPPLRRGGSVSRRLTALRLRSSPRPDAAAAAEPRRTRRLRR